MGRLFLHGVVVALGLGAAGCRSQKDEAQAEVRELPVKKCAYGGRWDLALEWEPREGCPLADVPRAVVVYVREGNGAREYSPAGLRPRIAIDEGTSCGFRFEGPESGLPEETRLEVNFDESGGQVSGKGSLERRLERTATGASGCFVDVKVRGTRTPGAAYPGGAASPDDVAGRLLEACAGKDANAFWGMAGATLRQTLEDRAREFRQLPAATLNTTFGFSGAPEKFDGRHYLAGVLQSGGGEHPCPDAARWVKVSSGATDGGHAVVYRRPDGSMQAVRLSPGRTGWEVGNVTSPRP